MEAGRRIQERQGKQKANNKESVTPASQKGESRKPWENGKSTTNSPSTKQSLNTTYLYIAFC